MSVRLSDIVAYLDDYLRITEVLDDPRALNGLQVESSGEVSKITAAVDACLATIESSIGAQGDLLLVHHGLFWRGLEPITGRHWQRMSRLLASDIALYAAHLPLDCHPEVGNNAILARELGLADPEPFGELHGTPIGLHGVLDLHRDQLVSFLRTVLGVEPRLIATGPERVSRVGIVSGAAGSMIRDAKDAGLDTFVTGEGAHHTYFDAEEWGLNVIYAGHYATETVGVKALAEHVGKRFGIPWEFLEHPTGL